MQRIQKFLGVERFWALVGMLVGTGLLSLALVFVDAEWTVAAQTALALSFIIGAVVLLATKFVSQQTALAIAAPAIGLVILGLLIVPQFQAILLGGAIGWIVAGFLIFGRSGAPLQYRTAIKAMRKQNFAEAVDAMDELIKLEPDNPTHYRFRAELLRLWGKLGRARRDYEMMLQKSEREDDRAIAHNGLAEVQLQAGNYQEALQHAQDAFAMAPDGWVTAYNLGMIQDRMNKSEEALISLQAALDAKVPDSRHRLLIHLYRARALSRLGDHEGTQQALNAMKRERDGLNEWQKIMESDEATILRSVLEADIEQARRLVEGEAELTVRTEATA